MQSTPFRCAGADAKRSTPVRAIGAASSAAGLWMLVAEQARLGLGRAALDVANDIPRRGCRRRSAAASQRFDAGFLATPAWTIAGDRNAVAFALVRPVVPDGVGASRTRLSQNATSFRSAIETDLKVDLLAVIEEHAEDCPALELRLVSSLMRVVNVRLTIHRGTVGLWMRADDWMHGRGVSLPCVVDAAVRVAAAVDVL